MTNKILQTGGSEKAKSMMGSGINFSKIVILIYLVRAFAPVGVQSQLAHIKL